MVAYGALVPHDDVSPLPSGLVVPVFTAQAVRYVLVEFGLPSAVGGGGVVVSESVDLL